MAEVAETTSAGATATSGRPVEIFGDADSGNCVKVLLGAVRAGVSFRWHPVNTAYGQPRDPEVERLNAAGQVPILLLPDGRTVAQSGAILLYLLGDTTLVPEDPFERPKMLEWMFWEQYSHEPYIAVCRSQMRYTGKTAEEREPWRVERGERALDMMDRHLSTRDWLVGDRATAAEIALFAYTRWTGDGGFDLQKRPALTRWIAHCEAQFADELAVLEWVSAGGTDYGRPLHP